MYKMLSYDGPVRYDNYVGICIVDNNKRIFFAKKDNIDFANKLVSPIRTRSFLKVRETLITKGFADIYMEPYQRLIDHWDKLEIEADICTCPNENFKFFGIGCTCGVAKKERVSNG